MLNVSTQQLEYLVTAADGPTWADAAVKLGVTAPALSQGLSQLERRLGVRLFESEGRLRVLREEAGPVLAYARDVVARTRDLDRWAEASREGKRGRLRVGMIDLAATVYFGPLLQRFRRDRPDVELHLAVGPSGSLCEELLSGTLSVAVVVEPATNVGDLAIEPLLEDELAVYGPDESATGDVPVGEWGPWVTFPVGSHTRDLASAALAEAGAKFEVVAESHQPEVLRGMVALGMGWTVLPVLQAEAEPNPLVPVRRERFLSRRLVVARRHDAIADPIVEAFVELLIASLDR